MPLEARLLTGLALAVAVVYWATPLAIRVADRLEFYDRPVGYKGHAAPTPYLGGAAVIAGLPRRASLLLAGRLGAHACRCSAACVVLWAVGTVDDRRTVTPLGARRSSRSRSRRACGRSASAGTSALGAARRPRASRAFWVVAVVNAFNLFDNMDGAASSMAAVVAAGARGPRHRRRRHVAGRRRGARCAARASASCRTTFASPARIFLGDGGSMPIGFAVAALAMIGVAERGAAWQSLAMGLLFVGVPALDTTLVSSRAGGAGSRSSPAAATTSPTARASGCAPRARSRSRSAARRR